LIGNELLSLSLSSHLTWLAAEITHTGERLHGSNGKYSRTRNRDRGINTQKYKNVNTNTGEERGHCKVIAVETLRRRIHASHTHTRGSEAIVRSSQLRLSHHFVSRPSLVNPAHVVVFPPLLVCVEVGP